MMANCPKCGKHLRLIDWKQHCPHCGTNIFVYNQQERLMQDADIAEVQYYHFQKKIDKIKAAYVGTKLAILRIFTSLLPVVALILPLVKIKAIEPFNPMEGNISLIDLVNKIDQLTGNAIPTLLKGDTATPTVFLVISLGLLLLSVVVLLLHFIFIVFSCFPRGKVRTIVFDVLLLITTIGSVITFAVMPDGGAITGSLGIGAFLYIALQIVNVVIDYLIIKKGIPVHHKQCYVGGIPIEEYFEMQKKGMTTEEIRVIQYERLQAIQEKKLADMEAKRAEEEKKKEEATANG